MKNFLASSKGIILSGLVVGLIAPLLQFLGNPPNMGICVACFERDFAGALGLHHAAVVQYMRPEIIGIVIGAFLISLLKKENISRGGSSPLIRFALGMFAMIGALVFLGCPWRAILRLAGGDLNAVFGILGLTTGIFIASLFLNNGFSLGRAYKSEHKTGWIFPSFMIVLFLLFIFKVKFAEQGAIFFSSKGPGAMHVNPWIGLVAAIIFGMILQRSRFCTMGAIRDLFIIKDSHLLKGVVTMLVSATIFNLIAGQFNLGLENQPIAHSNILWNFLGMVLSGLAFALAGGCPGRQLILAGEGDNDSAVFVLGMFAGAAVAHNFSLASSPKGITTFAPYAVILGIIFCIIIGFTMRKKFN